MFAATPSELRARSGVVDAGGPGVVRIRLAFRPPYDVAGMREFLAARAVDGVESLEEGVYRRRLRLPRGSAVVALRFAADHVAAELRLDEIGDLSAAAQRCRRMLDLDADPVAVDEALAPLGPRGGRVPGGFDGWEIAARAVVGQQVSLASARRTLARLVDAGVEPGLFPDVEWVASLDPARLPLPLGRAQALVRVAQAVVSGDVALDPGADRDETCARLLALRGVGRWTVDYIRMRALGDPDVLLSTDLIIRRQLHEVDAAIWAPWRSYATVRLWNRAGALRRRTSRGLDEEQEEFDGQGNTR